MAKNNDIKILSVRLDKQYVNRIEDLLESVNCSHSEFMKRAIDFYLSNHKVDNVIIQKKEFVRLSA